MAYDGIDNVKDFEPTATKSLALKKRRPTKTKTISNLELFCWECKKTTVISQTESGIPVACEHCGEYMITPKGQFAPNVVIGDFVIKQKLGSGGAGTVFLAYQRSLDRLCALKVLHDALSTGDEALVKEARIAAKLNHKHMIQCYAVNSSDTLSYYAMEYVSGRSLKEVLEKHWTIPAVKALNIAIQVCEALDHGWKESRLIHQDIKPDNIMISEDGDVKLADLGLAKLGNESVRPDDKIFRGTPEYASPESIQGQDADFRGDMYSLGAVLYQAITGNAPFTHTDVLEILKSHLKEKPVSPRTHVPDLNKDLSKLIIKLLGKTPDDRYPSYNSLLTALRKIRHEICSTSMQETNMLLDGFNDIEDIEQAPKHKGHKKAASGEKKKAGPVKRIILAIAAILIVVGFIFKEDIKTFVQVKEREYRLGDFMHLAIASALPDPIGYDAGNEKITIFNKSKKPMNLRGSYLVDNSGNKMGLSGIIPPGESIELTLDSNLVQLDNMGDTLKLFTPSGKLIDEATYTRDKLTQGKPIFF